MPALLAPPSPSFPVLTLRPPPKLPAALAPGSEGAGQAMPAPGAPDGQALREVAQGFEAMLLRQVLKAAAQTAFAGDSPLGSSANETFREMRDARFADLAASSGALGLAAQIEAQLAGSSGAPRALEPGG